MAKGGKGLIFDTPKSIARIVRFVNELRMPHQVALHSRAPNFQAEGAFLRLGLYDGPLESFVPVKQQLSVAV